MNDARLDMSAVLGKAFRSCCLTFNDCSEDTNDWSGADAVKHQLLAPNLKMSKPTNGRRKDCALVHKLCLGFLAHVSRGALVIIDA